ncbi:IQ domain-containing protein E isoform X2 [Thamnophis elegans]|uniref:IQ domain-containing protein E isoform X2 n=1 Tax=Thamnophis elegans TaxID=35005 RepID=UPI001376FDEB|nr:IQ domain-containing protein E isoform X2 [Thamnophis elegans]
MSRSPSEAAEERESVRGGSRKGRLQAEDNSLAPTYDSDTETTLKKKMSRRPAKSRSPYTSYTCLHSKRTGFLRTFKSAESKRFESPLVKASKQYWRGSLKQGTWMSHSKSDIGIRTASSPLAGSTPEYLKEALGMKKPKHARSASRGYIPGTPDYKEKEDMYDEIIELKKTIQAQKCEADRMKTKLRRVEEDNTRKDRQMEQLLEPFKYSEFSWVRTEQKNDSSLMINGLKQKILRLEQQCKEKDNTINQLQADMKNTNMEEMTVALHTSYQEIRRLQNLLTRSKVVQRKASESPRQKMLSTAVFQLSERMKELQEQNERLKAEMDHALSSFLSSSQAKNYLARQRQKLFQLISDGEKEVEDGLQPSEASRALLLSPTASEEADGSVAKESDLSEASEALGKNVVVAGLRDRILVLQNQLAVKEAEIQQLKQKLRGLEENQEIPCRKAGIEVTQPPDQAPGSSSRLCSLSGVVGGEAGREEEEEERKTSALRPVQSASRAHVTQAPLEEQPLPPSSPGTEKESEEKVGWSLFKFSPLVFTSDSASASHRQRQASPSKLQHPGAESDDSDEIITVMSSFPRRTPHLPGSGGSV